MTSSSYVTLFLTRLRLLFRLTPEENWHLLKAWLLLHSLRIILKHLALPRTLKTLRILSRAKAGNERHYLQIKNRVIWALDTVNPFVSNATCLPRALTAKTLLAQAGFECILRIGVIKSDQDKLEAHAWLERDGHVIIGHLEDLDRYTLLPTESIDFF